jgi:hypothetical protein
LRSWNDSPSSLLIAEGVRAKSNLDEAALFNNERGAQTSFRAEASQLLGLADDESPVKKGDQ